jgi:hypothetical protein
MFGYYKIRKKLSNYNLNKKFNDGKANFHFVKKSDELFLFGNGYTLKEFSLDSIIGKDCFTCNVFFRMPDFKEFTLKNNVLDFGMDSFATVQRISKRTGNSVEQILKDYINPKLGIGISLIRKLDYFEYVLNFDKTQSISTFKELVKEYGFNKKDKDLSKTFGHTPQTMIHAGILMNYKKIHLYGLEHNYVKDILNKDSKCGTHFYGDTYEELLLSDRGPGDRNHFRIKLSKLFEGNAHIFKGYEQLADLAKERGIEIIDHSGGSLFMFQDYSLWDLVEPKDKN